MTTRRQGQGPGGGPFTYGLQFQTTSEWGIDRRPSYAACLPALSSRSPGKLARWMASCLALSLGWHHACTVLVSCLAGRRPGGGRRHASAVRRAGGAKSNTSAPPCGGVQLERPGNGINGRRNVRDPIAAWRLTAQAARGELSRNGSSSSSWRGVAHVV